MRSVTYSHTRDASVCSYRHPFLGIPFSLSLASVIDLSYRIMRRISVTSRKRPKIDVSMRAAIVVVPGTAESGTAKGGLIPGEWGCVCGPGWLTLPTDNPKGVVAFK